MKLLLISNSLTYGQGFFDHCADEIVDFLGSIKSVLFIPYTLKERNKYEKIAAKRFKKMGIKLMSIHHEKNPVNALYRAKSIFIGGGNTFRLIDELYRKKLLIPIRRQVISGIPYIGSSAGSNAACPTIKTTNDMPIVEPPSFKALNLIPFQINPHYIDKDPKSKHMGEIRETRIKEFLEENNSPVLGLREGSWLRIEGKSIKLKGSGGALLFRRGKDMKECKNNTNLNFLLN